MKKRQPTTNDLVEVMNDLLVPFTAIERTIRLEAGRQRMENDAEHSFVLATLGCALAAEVDPKLDLGKVAQYGLVHDLVEVFAGDTTIWAADEVHATKPAREAAALDEIRRRYDASLPWFSQTIARYERLDEPESCFVYALDKVLPHLAVITADHQPIRQPWEIYLAKEEVNRRKITDSYPALLVYFNDLCQLYAKRPHLFPDVAHKR